MKTPRIEEMIEDFERNHPGTMRSLMGLEVKDFLRQALTQAHQAGIDEAVEKLHRLYDESYHHCKDKDGSTTYITEKDFDNIVKTLQDNK